MSVRIHPLLGEPILFAPARASRPRAFADQPPVAQCPFCAGNEAATPPEIGRIGEPWRIRVFPNKYPPAEGAEVIVESPYHDTPIEQIASFEEALQIYVERLQAHPRAAYVALFKNEGVRAGASIQHTHSQVVPLPFVPPRVMRELENFARGCPLCTSSPAVIRETRSFHWLSPEPSWMPYQQWIVPKRHVAAMNGLNEEELVDLAVLLRHAAVATHRIGDFNWLMMNFPPSSAAHFYIDIVPRTTNIAGLELSTGTFVEIMNPDAVVRRLSE